MMTKSSDCQGNSVMVSHATGPCSRLKEYDTLSTELLTDCPHNSNRKLKVRCVFEWSGRISQWHQTQDIQMGSFGFQCNTPHQCITQQQLCPLSVYCDRVDCHVLYLRHGIPVWQHIGQSITATSRHRRDMTLDVKEMLNPNKET